MATKIIIRANLQQCAKNIIKAPLNRLRVMSKNIKIKGFVHKLQNRMPKHNKFNNRPRYEYQFTDL